VHFCFFRVHLAPVAKKVYFDNKKKFIKTHTRSKNTSCKVNNSFMFIVFCCVGSLALPKKDTIDPWRLAMLGIGSVRPDN
jgi:hypothetical protein